MAELALDSFAEITVVEQELGRVLTLTTAARRESVPLAVNALSGVVTEVAEAGEHDAGDVLYRVGGMAVVLVRGASPFWRDLGPGMNGQDVEQVQTFLESVGAEVAVDGRWGPATTAAVKAWQKSRDLEQTGMFALGELVAAPDLPVAIGLDAKTLRPGALLAGGEELVSIATGEPTFFMEVTQGQAELIASGTGVVVHDRNGQSWTGMAGQGQAVETGYEIPVTAPDGSVLCGSQCGLLPPAGFVYLLTDVAVRPPVIGPVVPLAAIGTNPDGSTSVTVVEAGTPRAVPVTVVSAADGLAVVDGIDIGDVVRVFGTAEGEGAAETPAGPS